MPILTSAEQALLAYADAHRDDLISILQTLVRTPSENTPPTGAELACQQYCEQFLRRRGFATDLYNLSDVAGLAEHPLYFQGRDYTNRPNLAAKRTGSGRGRSLILTGHIDTVPAGTLPWTRDPFSGHIENGRLYGRGSNDMKAGIAANLFVAQALDDLGLGLAGDLTIESVVDEEFGGVNGTLAGRVRGYLADAAIITEPSFLRICPSNRGGRTVHIAFRAPNEGILSGGMEMGVTDQLAWFLAQLPEFAALRRASAPPHPAYAHVSNPVPVSILKVTTGPWGTREPMALANRCDIELFWQTMPGEDLAQIDAQFDAWFSQMIQAHPGLFPSPPEIVYPLRWLPGSSMPPGEALVTELSACAEAAIGQPPPVQGIESPCDMFVFHQAYGIPAVLWGATGSNTHLADEYVDIESVVASAKALLLFVYRWCGAA